MTRTKFGKHTDAVKPLLPEAFLRGVVESSSHVPRYLDERDHPWLRDLMAVYDAHAGARRFELDSAVRTFIAGQRGPGRARRAAHILDRLVTTRARIPIDPRAIRLRLFAEGATTRDRAQAVQATADALGISAPDVDTWLFADFGRERRVDPLPEGIGPNELALRANLALVQSLVARSEHVRVSAESGMRDIVRHVRLVGLMCSVARAPAVAGGVVLDVSGPFSLFRSTRLYGGALASVVPRLAWCRGFRLDARARIDASIESVRVASGDPIFPSLPPRTFDSKLEARFAKDFAREAKDYELLREPGPVEVDGNFVFPDFRVRRRLGPDAGGSDAPDFLLEIVGFWTPEYLEKKLSLLRSARLERFVLCIDVSLSSRDTQLPHGARVVWFKRWVSVPDVLTAMAG